MNPLAAALLAAQGWDVSRLRKQGQSQGIESNAKSNPSPSLDINALLPSTSLDINALLSNPAILQALQSQAAIPVADADPPLTPGQTTRFGRISRPPVAAPPQDQLALLQQLMGGGNDSGLSNVDNGSSARRAGQANSNTNTTRGAPLRTNGTSSKRPHSTLRETSLPRSRSPETFSQRQSQSQSPPRDTDIPLVRPVPPAQTMGRPRKGETTTKEERAERRRTSNMLSAADYRKKKEIYMQSLEDRIRDKEQEIKAKAAECEMWRRKFADMEKQHAVLTALWTAAGFDLPNENGSVQASDRFLSSNTIMPSTKRPGGVRNIPDARNAPAISPAALNSTRSPVPMYSAQSTPNAYPSPALASQHPTPMASASTTLATAMPPPHPVISPSINFNESSPVGTAEGDGTPFDFGVDLSAFDDFFNWDIQPDNDVDDQQDADFIPASSPHRSDSEEETDHEGGNAEGGPRKKRKSTKNKGKAKGKGKHRDDDEEFIDPEVDEEDLFMPIKDVEVPPGQMQLVEKATKDVMSTFGVDSQVQLTGVMQKIVDAGEGLTGEQLEKMKSVLRWMHMSGRLPGAGV